MDTLTVCITAYNQEKLTVAHVIGCMSSSKIPDEIIVVNDGGNVFLKEMLKSIPDRKCPIIYARITEDIRWNQNGARNLAIWLSRGDLLAFEDNDHIPHKDFYKDAIELINKGYDRVCVKKRLVISEQDIYNKPMSEWKPIHTRGTAQIISIIKRENIVNIKGFDENYCGHYGWEVPDFVERINKIGEKTIGSGFYYVAPVFSRTKDREFMGINNRPKMELVNYHLQMRNRRNNIIQPQKGILNFQWTYEKF